MNTEYVIYSDTKWADLEKHVTAALNRGGQCQGGICVIVDNGTRVYMQAMLMPKE